MSEYRYTATLDEQTTLEVLLVDDNNIPISLRPGFPKVTILDEQDNNLGEYIASPVTNVPGKWEALIYLPPMELADSVFYNAKWYGIDQNNNVYAVTVPMLVSPKETSVTGDQVLLIGDSILKITLPGVIPNSNNVNIVIYKDNTILLSGAPTVVQPYATTTFVSFTLTVPLEPSLVPYLVSIKYPFGGTEKQAVFNLWMITPRVGTALNDLEAWLNKAKIQNVIPSLRYTWPDLVRWLSRGLNLFNGYAPIVTCFNGLNMQGPLYELWLLCAEYYALGAQLQAEGALAFDFSGQAVTLNVDRTGQLDSALSRIESLMNERITEFKGKLDKYGTTCGDGSQSFSASSLRGITAIGLATLSNAPTTRLSYPSNTIKRHWG